MLSALKAMDAGTQKRGAGYTWNASGRSRGGDTNARYKQQHYAHSPAHRGRDGPLVCRTGRPAGQKREFAKIDINQMQN